MPKVSAFEWPGHAMWFWSADHEPPHFHAKRPGEWEVKVFFLRSPSEMIEPIWITNKVLSGNARRKLARLAERHRLELLEQWERIHGDPA